MQKRGLNIVPEWSSKYIDTDSLNYIINTLDSYRASMEKNNRNPSDL